MATRIAARYISRRLSSSGKVLSEEEKAAENVYIKVNLVLVGHAYGLDQLILLCHFSWQVVVFCLSFLALY